MSERSLLSQWKKNAALESNKEEVFEKVEHIPLTAPQQRLWILCRLFPEDPFYNYAESIYFPASVDLDKLLQGLKYMVSKHDILRTIFYVKDGKAYQKILASINLEIEYTEIPKVQSINKVREFGKVPFDLELGPLLRILVCTHEDQSFTLGIAMHHIIGDRQSMQVMHKEWAGHYDFGSEDDYNHYQFADYAIDHSKIQFRDTSLQYWRKLLTANEFLSRLPSSSSHEINSHHGNVVYANLNQKNSTAVKAYCHDNNCTEYTFYLTVFQILLSKYGNTDEVCSATPINARDSVKTENMLGFLNETLIVANKIDHYLTFNETLSNVEKTLYNAYEHKDVPLQEIIKAIGHERQQQSNPLFQSMFLYNSANSDFVSFGGIDVRPEIVDLDTAKFDLTLFVTNINDVVQLKVEYNTAIYKKEFIEAFAVHFKEMTASCLSSCSKKLKEIEFLSTHDRSALALISKRYLESPFNSIIDRFIETCSLYPERVALRDAKYQFTYEQLNAFSNQLANKISSHPEFENVNNIGLMMSRSAHVIIGILAVLKVGKCYVPLDDSYPPERIQWMAQDAECKLLLVDKNQALNQFDAKDIIDLSQIQWRGEKLTYQARIKENDLAYIIYTSGSSGTPKGVMINHQNLAASTFAREEFYSQQVSGFLLLSSFAFDSSVAGIYWTLTQGGLLYVAQVDQVKDVNTLVSLIKQNAISHTLMIPSLYEAILDYAGVEELLDLKCVIVAGEACSSNLVDKHFKQLPKVKFVNEYGPTEGTVWASAHVFQSDQTKDKVPIGKAPSHLQAEVCDRHLSSMPIFVPGEIVLSGIGLSPGYWGRSDNQKFTSKPNGDRVYRTGDIGYYDNIGNLFYLGRRDNQYKINGYRIELGEIESILKQYPEIRDARVILNQSGDKIIAFIESDNYEHENLKIYLSQALPTQMVPHSTTLVNQFPKLPNGKIDDRALRKIGISAPKCFDISLPDLEPRDRIVYDTWKNVLNLDQLGLDDPFFSLGGTSLDLIRVVAQLRQENIEILPVEMYRNNTLRSLFNFLGQNSKSLKYLVPLKDSGEGHPLFCLQAGDGHVIHYQYLAEWIDASRPLYALQPGKIVNGGFLHTSLQDMAKAYLDDILTVVDNGPIHLLGTCFSNALVLEIERLLRDQKIKIGELIIFDSAPNNFVFERPNIFSKTINWVAEGNYTRILSGIRNKLVVEKKLQKDIKPSVSIGFSDLYAYYNDLIQNYSWKSIDSPIHLLRSTEFANDKNKDYHTKAWSILTKDILKMHTIEGNHHELFSINEVNKVALVINEILNNSEITEQN